MERSTVEKIKFGIVPLVALAILTACGDSGEDLTAIDTDSTAPEQEVVDESAEADDNDEIEETTEADETDEPTEEIEAEENTSMDEGDTADETTQAAAGVLSIDFSITFYEAVEMFYNTFDESVHIDEIELDNDDGFYFYEFEGWDGEFEYELDINVHTGEIVKQEIERDSNQGDQLEVYNYISPEEAMQAAVEATGVDFVDEWELEFEDGRPVYEIDMIGAPDQDIDAMTGEVLQ